MENKISNQGFIEFVFDFFKTMKQNKINLVYEGEITHQVLKAFTSLTESKMEKEEEGNMVQKRVFHVMVECLQNISKHADKLSDIEDNKEGMGIFMVSKGEKEYSVTTGNVINNNKIVDLKKLLEHINSLNKEELTELYKKQIKLGKLSERGGAGLGFIDIKRKTGEKLNYHFLPVNETSSFFIFTSTITRKK